MATIKGFIRRVEQLDTGTIIDGLFEKTKDDLLEYNKEQMMQGKNNRGTDITPSYLNDPYFKSRESAQRYSDWKDKITPNEKRNSGTPNLYINGAFHNSITITANKDRVIFQSSFARAGSIENKFKNIYGLGGDMKKDFIDLKLRPLFIADVRQSLKL